jgi:ACS family D-galactonate transporter-like MFS transporter
MPLNERGRGAALLDGGAPLGAAFGSLIIATLISQLGLGAYPSCWQASVP